ncbi:hypothetical protein [Brockia lithotrophica]|uniref:hypothetical protein n=1 Tax=Brockia lithotrophica TaxID=933949 RepID=UPI0011C40BEA|nr:hypothetical protein [Brockia lithotrophica]
MAITGKEEVGGSRKALKNKLVMSVVGEGERLWGEVHFGVASQWDIGQVKEIYLGNDGVGVGRAGGKLLPWGALHVLDPYYLLNWRLVEGFWHAEENYFQRSQTSHSFGGLGGGRGFKLSGEESSLSARSNGELEELEK